MKQYFKAQFQNMAQSEILDMISSDTLARIKQKDPSPEFRAYVVGHEGEARPSMVGGGEMVFQYLQDAVVKLGNKIRQGIAVFMNHAATNTHEGRKPIGEVVGKKFADIAGKLSAIAALYIYPEYRNKKLDVASIEADVEYSLDDSGVAQVESFNNLTGIALGDGNFSRPAFPGATLLASLQAFQKSQGKFTHNREEKMTLEEIKEAIKEGKFSPSQLFAKEVLTSDQIVVDHVRAEKQTEYEHAKRVERKLQEEREAGMKKEKDYEAKIAEFSGAAIRVKSSEVLKNLIAERKLNEQQAAFVNKNAGTFKTEAKEDDLLKLDINKFIDGQLKEFTEVAKILGVKPPEDDKGTSDGSKGAASGDDDKGKDLEDVKNNPFIPGHEEAAGEKK